MKNFIEKTQKLVDKIMIYSKKVEAKSPDILSESRKPIIYNVNFSDEYTQVSKRELKGTSIIKIIIDNSSNGKKK